MGEGQSQGRNKHFSTLERPQKCNSLHYNICGGLLEANWLQPFNHHCVIVYNDKSIDYCGQQHVQLWQKCMSGQDKTLQC